MKKADAAESTDEESKAEADKAKKEATLPALLLSEKAQLDDILGEADRASKKKKEERNEEYEHQ